MSWNTRLTTDFWDANLVFRKEIEMLRDFCVAVFIMGLIGAGWLANVDRLADAYIAIFSAVVPIMISPASWIIDMDLDTELAIIRCEINKAF